MPDVNKALKDRNDPEVSKIKQLSSHLAVEEALAQKPNLLQVYQRCLTDVQAWDEQRNETQEPTVAGWINLFAELLRVKNASIPGLQDNPDARFLPELPSLLALLVLARKRDDGQALRTAIAGRTSEWKEWPRRAKGWQDLFLGGDDKNTKDDKPNKEDQTEWRNLAKTDLGQTLILHLLEAILGTYEDCAEAGSRGQLNVLLVPLLRAVFTYPDRAHAAYERYLYGYGTDGILDAFTRLYEHDLVILEEFQDYSISLRPETIARVRDAAGRTEPNQESNTVPERDASQRGGSTQTRDLPDLPDVLLNRANRILHGVESHGPTTSPRPKRIRISQLTCLIRDLPASVDLHTKAFSSHLKKTHYRRMQSVSHAPAGPEVTWTIRETSEVADFLNCVGEYYAKGYKPELLQRLFRAEDPSPGTTTSSFFPTWIHDGEVTFLWLVSGWSQVLCQKQNLQEWLSTRVIPAPSLPHHIIVGDPSGRATGEARQYFGESLHAFATACACLFDSNGQPLPKAWALVDFLERAVVYGRIPEYGASDCVQGAGAVTPARTPSVLASIASKLYKGLSDAALSLDLFKRACEKATEQFDISEPSEIAEQSRFPSFFLELVLRNQDPVPYSLFFYPLAFDAEGLPIAFLAGTFAGLEWSSYPSVTERQNCHLFVLIDGLRPIVDFEVGRVLAHDQRSLAETARRETEADERRKAAEQREKTAREIVPAIEDLSKLFEDAQGRVFQIQAAIDPDWGGLFTGALDKAIEKCFSDGEVTIESNETCKQEAARPRLAQQPPKDAARSTEVLKAEDWGRDPEQTKFTARHREGRTGMEPATLLYDRLVYIARDKFGYDGGGLIPSNERVRSALLERMPKRGGDGRAKLATVKATDVEDLKVVFRNNEFFSSLFLALDDTVAPDLNILLRLLTQGATEAARGLHIAQLAAALGMTAESTRTARRCTARISGLSDTSLKGLSFNPKTVKGLQELAAIISAEQVGKQILSTGDLKCWVTLAGGMSPFRFLRALKLLGGEALSPADTKKVKLDDWDLRWLPPSEGPGPTNEILVRLFCRNHFSPTARADLWRYVEQREQGYHNLRTNFRDLCLAVGSPPVFTKDTAASPDVASPFFLVEDKEWTHFKFVLGCSLTKNSQESPPQGD